MDLNSVRAEIRNTRQNLENENKFNEENTLINILKVSNNIPSDEAVSIRQQLNTAKLEDNDQDYMSLLTTLLEDGVLDSSDTAYKPETVDNFWAVECDTEDGFEFVLIDINQDIV